MKGCLAVDNDGAHGLESNYHSEQQIFLAVPGMQTEQDADMNQAAHKFTLTCQCMSEHTCSRCTSLTAASIK